jgi:hypothetical protein
MYSRHRVFLRSVDRWKGRQSNRPLNRGRARRTGITALALLSGTAVSAVLLASRFHLGGAAAAVTILGGLPSLYLAWAAYRDAGLAEEASDEKLAHGKPIEQWEPVDLGVHGVIGGGPIPPYVLRPHDEVLRAALDPSVTTSRLVVVRGEASTGKSRAAYEAVLHRLAGWRVDYPLTAEALTQRLGAGIDRRTVLWLRELRYYADADGGPMAMSRLADLLDGDGQVVAITTLWPEDWRKYTATASRSEHSGADPAGVTGRLLVRLPELVGRDVAKVDLRRGGVIDVPTRFTRDELIRANNVRDRVIAEAVSAARAPGSEGLVTQYLAGVPGLLQQYDGSGADPYGRAVITAAMDAARLGHSSPCPPGLLWEAAVGYLTDPQRTMDIGRWWDKALAYATEKINGVVRALEPVPPPQGTGVVGFKCADYLDLYGRRTRQDCLGPESLWHALCISAATPRDFSRLGDAAHDRGLYRYAVLLWTKAITGGNLYAAGRLTSLLQRIDPDRSKQAALWAVNCVVADDASGVARLLEAMRAAGAGDAVAVLAATAAENVRLEDPAGVARLLEALRAAGADSAVADLLARDPVGHASLGNPYGVARLLRTLREAGADDAVTALLACDPAGHVSLEDPAGVARLLEALRAAGADSAVADLLARDPVGHASLGNLYGVARLLRTLREAGAQDAATALVTRTVGNATIGDPSSVARLLETLQEAEADDAVTALLARDPGARASLKDPSGVARLLRALRGVGADDAVTALASRTADDATIGSPYSTALLLIALREAGAGDAVTTLLARDPAVRARLEDPAGVAWLLEALQQEEANDAVTTLLARNPAGHASLEDPAGVAWLLRTLREAGANDAVTALLARDPAGHASLEDPFGIAQLLRTLREAGAHDAVTALANRAVKDTSIDNPFGVAKMLEALHEAEVRDAINVLAGRAANAGMFNLFLRVNPQSAPNYKLGQELNGKPSQYWRWKEPSSQDHNMQVQSDA